MTKQAVDCRLTNGESEKVSEFDTPIPEWSSRVPRPLRNRVPGAPFKPAVGLSRPDAAEM
jgi:hypothetical protein